MNLMKKMDNRIKDRKKELSLEKIEEEVNDISVSNRNRYQSSKELLKKISQNTIRKTLN